MRILEYDQVDPLGVLQISLLSLDFAHTPQRAAQIRQTDPRPFPFFALYAVEKEQVLGQVGVFRLPMISTQGREDVGGVWAVSTHPRYTGNGIATMLLDEAHHRMRQAGLRFSTLGTNRYRSAYKLYQKHGYEDMQVLGSALARWETAHRPTRMVAHSAGPEGYHLAEKIFNDYSPDYLGFSWRHTPFAPMRDKVSPEDIWLLCANKRPVGYALAHLHKEILHISNVLLDRDIDIVEAVAAVVAEVKSTYVKVNVTRPVEIARLQRAGFRVAHPDYNAFMLKSLVSNLTPTDARQLYGIGSDDFLVSWLDLT